MLTNNGILLLWTPRPFLDKAIHLIEFWGLNFVNMVLVWRKVCKDGKPYNGLGKLTKHNYEYLLLAAKRDLSTHLRLEDPLS